METYPTTILLATDGSPDAVLAEQIATDLQTRSAADLHLVHAWQPITVGRDPLSGIAPEESYRLFRADAEATLAASADRIARAGGRVSGRHLRLGPPAREIVALSGELGADLAILGSRGLGPVRRLVLGSVSEAVAHDARCPTLIVRNGAAAWPPARIIAGDDGSADATRAASLGLALARLYGAALTLARAVPEEPDPPWYDAARRAALARLHDDATARARDAVAEHAYRLIGEGGRVPDVVVTKGDPAALLLELAEARPEPTLIAVGCRGLGPLGRLRLGSVSTTIIHAARGPILIVPHQSG